MTRAEQHGKAGRDGGRPASRNISQLAAAVRFTGGRRSRSGTSTNRASTARASVKKKAGRLRIVNSANDPKRSGLTRSGLTRSGLTRAGLARAGLARSGLTMANPEIYRPLKKPVTLRLDADVLAWFKKDGRRYQTRINQALRQVVEREMKSRRKRA